MSATAALKSVARKITCHLPVRLAQACHSLFQTRTGVAARYNPPFSFRISSISTNHSRHRRCSSFSKHGQECQWISGGVEGISLQTMGFDKRVITRTPCFSIEHPRTPPLAPSTKLCKELDQPAWISRGFPWPEAFRDTLHQTKARVAGQMRSTTDL